MDADALNIADAGGAFPIKTSHSTYGVRLPVLGSATSGPLCLCRSLPRLDLNTVKSPWTLDLSIAT